MRRSRQVLSGQLRLHRAPAFHDACCAARPILVRCGHARPRLPAIACGRRRCLATIAIVEWGVKPLRPNRQRHDGTRPSRWNSKKFLEPFRASLVVASGEAEVRGPLQFKRPSSLSRSGQHVSRERETLGRFRLGRTTMQKSVLIGFVGALIIVLAVSLKVSAEPVVSARRLGPS